MKNNEVTEILKKVYFGVIALIIICLLNLLVTLIYVQDKQITTNNTEETASNYDVSKFTEITASQINGQTKDKLSVIYIGRSNCSWCQKYVPILTEATVENDLNTLYIDIAKIIDFTNGGISDQDSYNILIGLDTVSGLEDYMSKNFGSTPMTLVVKDGKILASQTGYVDADTLTTFLQTNGLIK